MTEIKIVFTPHFPSGINWHLILPPVYDDTLRAIRKDRSGFETSGRASLRRDAEKQARYTATQVRHFHKRRVRESDTITLTEEGA